MPGPLPISVHTGDGRLSVLNTVTLSVGNPNYTQDK